MALYDSIGEGYINYRIPDSRISSQINLALGGAKKVVNVGAGTGSYEPLDREVIAVEPSDLMIAQRPRGSAPVIKASAESLPFENKSFDAAMAILTIHHWSDWRAGIQEMLRVAGKVVIFTWDPVFEGFWLTRDYFPEVLRIDKQIFPPVDKIISLIGNANSKVIPIPGDCTDGFGSAYWNRPEAYLNESVRKSMSTFARLGNIEDVIQRLKSDLDTGMWQGKYGHLLTLKEMDLGFRIISSVE
ncbi:MAG: SAM-dependent methyltransferase [Flaviaesturariibacter sp.]|nr:SAM-dependent methyltransferase [Flaviaesturariibacter sp.]